VREYIEAHLENKVSFQVLAGIAGLSMSHFAKAFKQSEGVAPHDYLVRRRLQLHWSFWLGRICLFRQLRIPQDSQITAI